MKELNNCVVRVSDSTNGRSILNPKIRQTKHYYKVMVDGIELNFHKNTMWNGFFFLCVTECIDPKIKSGEGIIQSLFDKYVTIKIYHNGSYAMNVKGKATAVNELLLGVPTEVCIQLEMQFNVNGIVYALNLFHAIVKDRDYSPERAERILNMFLRKIIK